MFVILFCGIFLLIYYLLISSYEKGWRSYSPPGPSPAKENPGLISVVAAARNEEKNIKFLLNALAAQTLAHTLFEVIIVDDYSTDGTAALVKNFPGLPVRLLQPSVPAEQSSKKKAIEAGVHAAVGALIVTTDADCIPGPRWLETVHDFYRSTNANFIAAPVKFMHNTGPFQSFQALDFMVLQGITAASVTMDALTMCNGANLAYRKKDFIDVNGFEGIDHVATGDDMLLMYKIRKQTAGRVFYLLNKDAIVETPPAKGLIEFIRQRKRWASKSFVYDDKRILPVLVFVYLFNFLFVVLLAAGFWKPAFWSLGLWCLITKTAIELPFVLKVSKFYNERRLLWYFPFFQPIHILYTVIIGLLSQSGRYEWKGRKTK